MATAVVIKAAVRKMKREYEARLYTARLTEETASQVSTVAAACEALDLTSDRISKLATDSGAQARRAVLEADRTRATVADLVSVAERIGALVTLIERIAPQTNLLALNATIEGRAPATPAAASRWSRARSRSCREARARRPPTSATDRDRPDRQAAVRGCIDEIGTSIARIDDSADLVAQAIA